MPGARRESVVIFVDSNVFLFALGGPSPLRDRAAARLRAAYEGPAGLCTSTEVLQEILHLQLRRGLPERFDRVLSFARRAPVEIWPVETEDLTLARALAEVHPRLEARDLLHLASCQRRQASDLLSFDRQLTAAWRSSRGGGRRARGSGPRQR